MLLIFGIELSITALSTFSSYRIKSQGRRDQRDRSYLPDGHKGVKPSVQAKPRPPLIAMRVKQHLLQWLG